MTNLLKQLHDRAETLKGKKLAFVLLGSFVLFILIGAISNYTIKKLLKSSEISENNVEETLVDENSDTYEGIVTFVDSNFYPNDNVSFYLADQQGKEIILLKAKDQKLQVSEGLHVIAQGKKVKTKDGKKEILEVDKVIIKQN